MRILFTFAALLISTPAFATAWVVDSKASYITFTWVESGKKSSGHIADIAATIDFDPKAPEKGSIDATIPLDGLLTDEDERRDELLSAEWFDFASFPQARYVSKTIKADGKGGFIAEGSLTLKGVTAPVTVSFTLSEEDGMTHASGKATVTRTDFKVGSGDFANDDTYVAFPVEVKISVAARPKA